MTAPLYVIMGPTASGKSALSLALAQRCHGEIINCDAMQLYRDLDVGTAKLTPEEQRGIPHHLLSVLDMNDYCDVTRFIALAEAKIRELSARNSPIILCGGTGYYIKSLLYGLDELPGDPALRAELDALYDRADGECALHERMQKVDPEDYQAFKRNRRKLIRALEVFLIGGKPQLHYFSGEKKMRYPVQSLTLHVPPEILRARITARAKIMFDTPWFDETRRAEAHGFFESPTAHQAIGYRIVRDYLSGHLTHASALEQIINRTAQYARRQRAWFAHQHPETRFLSVEEARAFVETI